MIAASPLMGARRVDPILPSARPLRRAAEWLWTQQSADGGWHSRTYGLLKPGQSLTPLVLHALLSVPEAISEPRWSDIDRAVAFLRHERDLVDYPTYSASLAAIALSRVPRAQAQHLALDNVVWLRTQQLAGDNGWTPDHAAYGAFGLGGDRRTPPYTGHIDLSMTRYALQAFHAVGVPSSDPVFQRAMVFVERCKNPDGGFFFSTIEPETNKAGEVDGTYRSYSSATADGILAQIAAGVTPDLRWFASHDLASSFPPARQRYARGLRFYYAAARAEVFNRLGLPDPLPPADLVADQRSDGSWSNPEALVKEDDPLIATSFAVQALARSLHS